MTGDPFLAEGEYIEEEAQMHIGTKVGEFAFSQRKKLSPTLEIEEIFSGDIYKETPAAQVSNDINENFKKFSEKFGIKFEQSSA